MDSQEFGMTAHSAHTLSSHLGERFRAGRSERAGQHGPEPMRALVVDDVAAIRTVLQIALREEGFHCDLAVDGIDALQHLADHKYDLVVTDLSMPGMNGHTLAVNLLERISRPRIVVHSGIDDARLAKDLMLRGVDDIVFKPTNYRAFAAKMKGLLNRRTAHVERQVVGNGEPVQSQATEEEDRTGDQEPCCPNVISHAPVGEPISLSDIEERLPLISRILPVSQAALDVFELTRERCEASRLANAIRRDPGLTAEVLSIANGGFYNPSGNPITELDRAVVRIGQRRTGEIALAASTLSSMTSKQIPWVDMQTIWRQSIAAGVAVELLVAQGGHGRTGESLALIAIMHSLGRIVLGTLYPKHYRHFVEQCLETGDSLIHQERRTFPESHSSIMARLLAEWNLSKEICEPLQYILEPYKSLATLPEEMRTQTELVKVAVFIGQVTMQAWHPWDLVEIPPDGMLGRLGIHDLGTILEQTRENAQSIVNSNESAPRHRDQATSHKNVRVRGFRVKYINGSAKDFDLVDPLLRSFGFEVVPTKPRRLKEGSKVLVNGLTASARKAAEKLRVPRSTNGIVISEEACKLARQPSWKTLQLPASCEVICRSLR